MTDFEPQTDLPERIEDDDAPIESSARIRDAAVQSRRRWLIRIGIVAAGIALIAMGFAWPRVLVAMVIMYLTLAVGLKMLGAFARPIPEPPPRGELRRVKLTYRCPSCGTELRMTLADDVVPQAPRHCADEMELTTPEEDL